MSLQVDFCILITTTKNGQDMGLKILKGTFLIFAKPVFNIPQSRKPQAPANDRPLKMNLHSRSRIKSQGRPKTHYSKKLSFAKPLLDIPQKRKSQVQTEGRPHKMNLVLGIHQQKKSQTPTEGRRFKKSLNLKITFFGNFFQKTLRVFTNIMNPIFREVWIQKNYFAVFRMTRPTFGKNFKNFPPSGAKLNLFPFLILLRRI